MKEQLSFSPKYSASALNLLSESGIIPVFTQGNSACWSRAIDTMYKNGIRAIEYSHTRDMRSLRLFHRLTALCQDYPDLVVGASTIFNRASAQAYIEAGAAFIASPFVQHDMAELCHRSQVLWIPGCITTGDISKAVDAGAQVVSLIFTSQRQSRELVNFVQDDGRVEYIPSIAISNSDHILTAEIHSGALCLRMVVPIFPKEATDTRGWIRFDQHLFSVIASQKNQDYQHVPRNHP